MRTSEQQRRLVGQLFLLPSLAVLALIMAYPIGRTLVMSFQSVRLKGGAIESEWVGFDNFLRLFGDRTFMTSLRGTLYFSSMEVVLVVLLSLGAALLLNHRLARAPVFRIMLLVPWALAPVANAVLWQWILNPNYGALNFLLKSVGLIDRNIVWLATPAGALNALLVVDVWKSMPFITLLLLAAVQRVPAQLYRAAYLDGANAFNRFLHVTLPQIRGTLIIATVLQAIWSLRIFDLIYVLTRGGPADATALLNFLAYRTTFSFLELGYGAAIADIVFIASLAFALIIMALMRPNGGGAR